MVTAAAASETERSVERDAGVGGTVACAQVLGGFGATAQPLDLPGLEGYLFTQPCQSETGGDIHIKSAGKIVIEAGTELHLKAGMKVIVEGGMTASLIGSGQFVSAHPAGVSVVGTMVNINSGGSSGGPASSAQPDGPSDPDLPDPMPRD